MRNGMSFEISIPYTDLTNFKNEYISNHKFLDITDILNNNFLVKTETENKNDISIKKVNLNILNKFPFVPYSDFFNPLIIFDLHPFLPIISIGSLDKSLRLFNFYTKEFICQKNFDYELTAIKFSNDGKLLALGFLNGNVFILDSHMTNKNYVETKQNNFPINNKKNVDLKIQGPSIREKTFVPYEEYNSGIEEPINNEDYQTKTEIFNNPFDKNKKNVKDENLDYRNFNLFHVPNLEILQIISDSSTSVILLNFSKYNDFIAISYNNKIIKNKEIYNKNLNTINDNFENKNSYSFQGGSIVSLYLFKFSKLQMKNNFDRKRFYNHKGTDVSNLLETNKNQSSNKQNLNKNNSLLREEIYYKISDISIPVSQYESTNMNRNECATTSIDFSDNSLYILLENQLYNKNSRSKNEAIYIVWDIENTQLVIDPLILKNLKFSSFSFSNSIDSMNYINYLNLEKRKKKDHLKLVKDTESSFDDKKKNMKLKTDVSKSLGKYNLVSNVDDLIFKTIDKSTLFNFNNEMFITASLPLLNFKFDYEYQFFKNNFSSNRTENENYTQITNKTGLQNNHSKYSISRINNNSLINQHICCGSSDGNIHFFRYIHLLADASELQSNLKTRNLNNETSSDNVSNEQYNNSKEEEVYDFNKYLIKNEKFGISRSFVGHCFKINSIKSTSDESFLFTSDSNDQIIIEWKIKKENINSDLDNFPLEDIQDDPFLEMISTDSFFSLIEDYWLNRLRLPKNYLNYFENNLFEFHKFEKANCLSLSVDNEENLIKNGNNDKNKSGETTEIQNETNNKKKYKSPNIEFTLSQVLGRRAIDRRKNLFCDLNNRLIYFTSSYVVLINLNSLNSKISELNQYFMIPVQDLTQDVQSEISCMTMSEDKQEIAIATNGEISLINIFEINTMNNISKFSFHSYPIVNDLKYSFTKEKLLVNAVNKSFSNVILVLNSRKNIVEALTILSGLIPYKIKDFEFEYKTSDVFITCGIQHLCLWEIKGNHLVNKNLGVKLENEQASNKTKLHQNNFYANKNKQKQRHDTNNSEEILNSENINNINDQVEIISNQLNNKKYGIFLMNDQEKIEEFINYNFCSRENYKKYYLDVNHRDFEEEISENKSNISENKEDNFYYKTEELEENDEFPKDNFTSGTDLNINTNEIQQENLRNNFYYNYYFENFLHVSFLCIKRIKKNFILAGDDGCIYLMQDYIIKNKIAAHSGFITCIEINEENKYLITGGLDGKINLFNMSIDSKGILRNIYKINTFFTYDPKNKIFSLSEILLETNFNAQSLTVINNKVLVGTRNGNIMEFDINSLSQESDKNFQNKKEIQENLSKNIQSINSSAPKEIMNMYFNKNILINFFDDHPPIDIALDSSSRRIFCISQKGFFYVYLKQNLKLLYVYDFKLKSKKLYHFKYQNKILIALENSLIVLDTNVVNKGEKNSNINIKSNEEYVRLPGYDLTTGLITDIQISSNEKLLAIASINNSNPQLYM